MRLKKLAPLFLALSATLFAARFGIDHIGRIVRLADPQIAPDGKSIALVVSRTNYEEDRYDSELVLVDVATHNQRALTRDRRGVSQARWSPDGSRLAFLATVDTRPQIFVLPMTGGDAWQVTKSPTGIQQYAWRPASNEIAYVASDEAPKVTGEERHNRAFEIQNNHFLLQEAPRPAHVWLIAADGRSAARRLTSGAWTLPVSLPPGAPSSPLSWSPDGKRLAIVKVAVPTPAMATKPQCSCSMSNPAMCGSLPGAPATNPSPCFHPTASASRTGTRAMARTAT
jgi:Tol biopolymer transport system component